MSRIGEILAGYGGLQASQEAFYQDLHQHPELSHQEHRTAERVAGHRPGRRVVPVTVGSIQAGTRSNVIPTMPSCSPPCAPARGPDRCCPRLAGAR